MPPSLDDYRQVIVKPAEKVGLEVEPELVEELLQQMNDSSGSNDSSGNLPILELVLETLWEKRQGGKLTLQVYWEKIGGLEGALDRKAKAVYESLDAEAQACAQWIFLELTNLGEGTEDTGRRVYKSDLVREKYPEELVERTLKALTDARLIVTNQEENEEVSVPSQESVATVLESDELSLEIEEIKGKVTVEIAHEILIRRWETLRWWLDKNRIRLRKQREIEQAANLWKEKGKHRDSLLRGARLVEVEEIYNNYRDELSSTDREYIKASQKARLVTRSQISGGVATFIFGIIAFIGFGWLQREESLQIIRDVALGIELPTPKLLKILPDFLTEANRHKRAEGAEDIARALAYYRQILTKTNQLQKQMVESPEEFEDIAEDKQVVKYISERAHKSLVDTIRKYRLPQLENELKDGNFGALVDPNTLKFENQYTGALRTTYAILMRPKGAKADINNDGYINEGEEELLPCEILAEIEALWRQFTEDRCGWYGSNSIYEEPNCRELGGHTLIVKLSVRSSIYLIERRLSKQCQVVPVPKSAS